MYEAELMEMEAQREYEDRFAPMATMGDAHREWHRNSGVPMGQPGCPQDACHPVYDDEDMEPSTNAQSYIPELPVGTGVKCGNKKGHAVEAPAYHATPADVRQCYALNGSKAPANPLADPGTVTPQTPYGTTHVTLTPPPAAPAPAAPKGNAKRVTPEEFASWRTIPVGKGDKAYYALETLDGHVDFFRVRRPSTGKYKGRTYVDQQTGDNFLGMPFLMTAMVLNKIVANPSASAVLYGQKMGKCALCRRSLTDDTNKGPDGLTSLERGIGPDCAKKVGMV